MTTVYFVRHAQSNYHNHDDLSRELTEKGLADRELVTKFLSDKQINAVFSSPYKRAIDTVKDFSEKYGLEIHTINEFRERKIDSTWIDDFTSFAIRQWKDFDYKLSDGETLREVQKRNIEALDDLLERFENKNIVIGSHGTALSTIINYYDNSFGYEDFERIKPLMPWIVKFTFSYKECIGIEKIDIFKITCSN